jgi:hypothetical protein
MMSLETRYRKDDNMMFATLVTLAMTTIVTLVTLAMTTIVTLVTLAMTTIVTLLK